MEESLGLGKKSSGPKTDTETWSWFRLPIPKQGFGCTLLCWYDMVELSEQNEGISLENKLSCKWILKFENCTKIELSLVYKNTLYWNFQIIKTGTISFQISDFCHF